MIWLWVRASMKVGFVGVVLSATLGYAFNEPDGFRGIPWKSSEAVARERLPGLNCMTPKAVKVWERLCFMVAPLPIGEVPVKLILGFKGGAFEHVLLVFDAAKFGMMERIFIERYGEPTARAEREVQNRMGARYTNELRYWTGSSISITLQKYGSKLTESWATFAPTTLMEDINRSNEEAAKKGAADL